MTRDAKAAGSHLEIGAPTTFAVCRGGGHIDLAPAPGVTIIPADPVEQG